MRPILLLAIAPLLLAPLAQAYDCNSSTQTDMTLCANALNKAADKELNTLYQQINQRLKDQPQSKKLLVSAQRAWLAFRDAECRFSTSGVEGGSLYPVAYSNCITALTKTRVESFKQYLKCEEGDLSCPVPRQ